MLLCVGVSGGRDECEKEQRSDEQTGPTGGTQQAQQKQQIQDG
jgi:hypothetical protein